MTRSSWTDRIEIRYDSPNGKPEFMPCLIQHRTKEAAYTHGAARLRAAAHVDRYHGPAYPYSTLALEVYQR